MRWGALFLRLRPATADPRRSSFSGRLWSALFLVISGVFAHSVSMASSVTGAATLVVKLLAALPAPEQAALFEACSLAHQAGRCIDASEATEADTLRATVDFSSDTRVTIEITEADPRRRFFSSRDLFFEVSDDREERARAIGLALGVLATTLDADRPTVEEGPPLPKKNSDDAPARSPGEEENGLASLSPRTARSSLGAFGLSISGGLSLLPSWGVAAPTGALGVLGFPHPNWGGVLRAQLAAYPQGPRNISMTHVSATLGPSFRTRTSPFFVSALIAAGIQTTEARLNVADAETRKGSHISPLGHAEVTLGRELGPGVALTFTPTFDVLLSATEILVDDEVVGKTGTTQGSILVGLLLMPSP